MLGSEHQPLPVIGLNSTFSRLSPDLHARPDQWLNPPALMEKEFAWAPEGLRNSQRIAEAIDDYWDMGPGVVPWDAMSEGDDLFRCITEYVEGLHGKPYKPFHPDVKDLLRESLGIMVYQEDVSCVAMALADFTPEEADNFRKVLTKKRGWGTFGAYQ
jgi:DNA polymerase III alpha subunit